MSEDRFCGSCALSRGATLAAIGVGGLKRYGCRLWLCRQEFFLIKSINEAYAHPGRPHNRLQEVYNSFDLHDVLGVCKYLSAITGAAFGAFGIFGEKQKDGKLTRGGKVALVGFVVSALIGVVTAAAEQKIDTDDRTEKQKQIQTDLAWQRKALTLIQRQLYSFSDLTTDVHIAIPTNSPAFGEWADAHSRNT